MRKILFGVIIALILFHAAWYIASRVIIGRPLPAEKVIRDFQNSFFARMKMDVRSGAHEESYLDINGNRLHLDVFPSRTGAMTVVFIPGTSVYAQVYLEFMVKLNRRGFNVVGFDPRGHGRSAGRRGDYTISEIVDDTLAVVRYARDRFKGRVAIAGSSQGGIVAFYAAARDESIAGAVCHNLADLNGRDNLLLSAFRLPPFLAPAAGGMLALYGDYAIPVSLYLDLSKEKLKDGTDGTTYVREDPLCVTWITLRAMGSLLETDLARPVEKIRVPVILIHSDRDNIFPQKYVEGLYNRLTCPKKYLLVKNRDHLVMTNYVDEVIGPVSDWLKGLK